VFLNNIRIKKQRINKMKVEINNSKLLLNAASGLTKNVDYPGQKKFEKTLSENIENSLTSAKYDGTLVVDILDLNQNKSSANLFVDARLYDSKGMAKSGLLDVIKVDKSGKLVDFLSGKMFTDKFGEMVETLIKRIR
jgi:hypothetical protein